MEMGIACDAHCSIYALLVCQDFRKQKQSKSFDITISRSFVISVSVLLPVFVIRFTFKPNHLSYLSYLCVILEVTKLRHLPESSSSSGLHSIDAYGR
jgi:hypothetical protein